MYETTDALVLVSVIGARFFVPLAIPRFPLPAIIATLLIDAVDQTIFEMFLSEPFEGYQGYDKALDVYYLTIAYISMLRNWPAGTAFEVGRFLWYYRLAGVVAFELTGARELLLVFPNTFEYFFIFYEAVRSRWDPARITSGGVVWAAAAIWIGIKLPQEYWIHVAQLDVTDMVAEHPWLIAVGIVLATLVAIAAAPLMRRLPPPDHRPSLGFDPLGAGAAFAPGQHRALQLARSTLAEKAALVSMVCVIFAQVLPNVRATNLQITAAVAFVVVINALFSQWLARRGTAWYPAVREFGTMALVNLAIVLVYFYLLRRYGGTLNLGTTLFFVLLLTLIVMLFDRYHQIRSQSELNWDSRGQAQSHRAPAVEARRRSA